MSKIKGDPGGNVPTGPARPRVGVVGLGAIGAGIARAVCRSGMDLSVCDVRAEAVEALRDELCAKGAGRDVCAAASAAELAPACEVVVVAVVNDEQARAVLTGPGGFLTAAPEGVAAIIVSTIEVATVRELGAAAAARGVALVDCGVSGGPGAAAAGELVSMVGGDPGEVEWVRPVLDAFSSLVLHMGSLGAGVQAKLARNLIQYGSWLAAYEAQTIAEAAGLDLAKLAQAVRTSDVKIGGPSTLMFRSTVAPWTEEDDAGIVAAMRSAAALAGKDMHAVRNLAAELGVEAPVAELTERRCGAIFGVAE